MKFLRPAARAMTRTGIKPAPSAAASRLSSLSRHMASSSSSTSNDPISSGDEPPVLFESAYSTRTFKLNRPKALNALDREMIDILTPKILEWDNSELCKIIIGTGVGRAFCAGGEVKSVVRNAANETSRQKALDYFQHEFQLDYDLATLTTPYVAIMDGITMGGGVGLSAYAPFRIATENTLFAMPESKIGYAPDVGSTYVLSRLDGELGTYLALTGESIKGYEAFRMGLATHYISSRRLPSVYERLGALEEPTPKIINETLEEFHTELDSAAEEAAQLTISKGDVRYVIDRAFSEGTVEKIIEVLQEFAGANKADTAISEVEKFARKTLDTLALRSPTSLKVALEAVRIAGVDGYRLNDALKTELGIATAFCSGASPDFITGVTSVLIDKSKTRPNWSPASLGEVSSDWVSSTFFDKKSPYVEAAPKLGLDRTSAKIRLMHFSLPTEAEIASVIKGEANDSGATALTFDELVSRFEFRKGQKGGMRSKLQEVVSRRCRTLEGGSLQWKY